MGDDALRIDIQTIGGERAVKILGTLAEKTQEVTDLLQNTGWGNKEISALTRELNSVTQSMSAYAKAVKDANSTNQSAALSEQKLATEMNKTAIQAAKLEMQQMKNKAAAEKMASAAEKANAPYNQLRTELSAAELALRNLYTTGEKGANLNSAISEYQRLSSALDSVNQKMRMSASGTYTRMNEELKQYGNRLRDAIAAGELNDVTLGRMGDKYKRLQSELNAVDAKFNTLTQTVEQDAHKIGVLDIALGNFIANTLQRAIYGMGDFVSQCSRAGVAMDAISNTFAAGARSMRNGGEEMQFVSDVANRLGLNLEATYEPYAKFMTSFTRSGGTLTQSRQIFEDLSTAMVSLHLSSAQMENVFVALEQMANKGTVQSEELKRQLGNALPGAFELAAQSMNVTAAELMDLMKEGKVMSKDFLPQFAAVVKDSLGNQIGIAANQFNAHFNRMQSQVFLLQTNVGGLMNEALTPLLKALTSVISVGNFFAKGLKDNTIAVTALQMAAVAFTGVVVSMTVKLIAAKNAAAAMVTSQAELTLGMKLASAATALWGNVTAVLTGKVSLATAAMTAFRWVLTAITAHPIIAALTALTGVVFGLSNAVNKANRQFEEMAVEQRNVTNDVVGMVSEFTQLADITNKSSAQQEAYNRNLNDLQERYPEILRYIQEHGISIKNVTQEQAENIAKMAVAAKMQEAEKVRMDELSNKWLIFGTRVKQTGGTVLLGLQAIGVGILHVVITVEQAITRLVSIAAKALGEITEKAAFVASKIGAKELAVSLDNATKSMKGFAASAWNVGISQREYLNEGLKQTAYWIENMEFERQEKAMQRYKDTVAVLGQEEAKLAQNLMYASNAVSGLTTGGDGKGKKSKKTKAAKEKKQDDAWDALNKEIKETEQLMKVRLLDGKSIDDLEPKYVRLKKVQDDVNNAIKALNETPVTGWERIKKQADEATKSYQYMLANSKAYTKQEIENAKADMKRYNALVKYNELLKKSEDAMQITSREAGKLANTLVDSLFDPLQEGESMWSRFKDAGVSALKAIATEWIKMAGNRALAGWTAGKALDAEKGLGDPLGNAFRGAISGLFKQPLEGTKNTEGIGSGKFGNALNVVRNAWGAITNKLGFGKGQTTGAAADITGGALDTLTNQATNLGNVLQNTASPAVDGVMSSISGLANPVAAAAGSIVSMATATPIAAAGMASMGISLTALAPAATTAAPALMQMGAALGTIAANASMAATSMAALAVATAAESVAKIPFVGGFLAPIAAGLTGAAIAAGTIMTGAGIAAGATIAGAGQMIGGGLSGIGNKLSGVSSSKIVPHAKGGIVSSPTMFPMQGGNVGLAGEAGTEVIAPAKRMSNGDLGIGAVAPQITVNNYTNAAVEVKRRPDNSMEIKIAELNSMLSSSKTNKGMTSAQSRLQKQGRQIG